MAVTRVVFIRPGETDWNRSKRWQGWVNAPLNHLGRQQAQMLAKFIRNIGLSKLYSSDLRRAVQTAELLSEQLGFAPIYDARLRERNIGLWQGLTLDEMRTWYPDEYTELLKDPNIFCVPGGESREDVKQRVLECFEEIVLNEDGETVGILSHTTAVKVLVGCLIPDCDERILELENTSVTTIARDGVGSPWRLVAGDDVMHLEGLEAQAVSELEYPAHDPHY